MLDQLVATFTNSLGEGLRRFLRQVVSPPRALRALPFSRVMLDGEAVAHCLDGLPHFHKLLSGDGQATACFYAFDLIWLEAQDLRGVELIGRRRMLQKALKKAGPALRFSEHMTGAAGEAMFRHGGLEGIISKARRLALQGGLVHRLGEGQELGI